MRYLYSALLYLLMPILLLRILWRSRRAPAYRQRLLERFGWFRVPAQQAAPTIWVHAVSVGETLAAAPLVEALLLEHPEHRVVVTSTTPTGSGQLQALFGQRVFHVYAPWDLPGAVQRFLRCLQPSLLLLIETELWPNMLHYTKASGCNIALVNARLSARSAHGYARIGSFTRQMLRQLDCVACQSQADGERFLSLGLSPSVLHHSGNIKFDLQLGPELTTRAASLREQYRANYRPVLVAASTHPGEDALILSAFAAVRETLGNCLLVLVPRHPERFDEVYTQCAAAGWQVVRRSSGAAPAPADDIVLGDTMGELLLLLSVASVVVMGGSLVPHGGHNVLEAAAWGVPVVSGPHMLNFEEVTRLLVAAGAMLQLQRSQQLAPTLSALLSDPRRCRSMGAAGQQVVAQNRGAIARVLQLLEPYLSSAGTGPGE